VCVYIYIYIYLFISLIILFGLFLFFLLDIDLEDFFQASEDWNSAMTISNSMAFISQFAEVCQLQVFPF
jgi:hypothetical protein